MDALETLPGVLRTRSRAVLATVIGVSGSTPSSALARMLVGESGERLAGTIGGGCVEGDVISAARDILASGKSAVMKFTLDEDHLESGMLCGGTLDVFIEPVTEGGLPFFVSLNERRDAGDDAVRCTLLGPDGALLDRFLIPPGARPPLLSVSSPGAGQGGDTERLFRRFHPERESLAGAIEGIGRTGNVARVTVGEGVLMLELVAGAPALYIFGGGHVSRAVSTIASGAGFRVTVIDDRPEFANPGRFPEAVRTIAAEFAASFAQIAVKPSSSIVIVTRGHRADETVLELAAATNAGYVGMIGSRKKVAAAFESLAARGVSPEALGRVHAPIGLDIGAVSPGEIAVSIVAELIHARRSPGAPLRFKSDPARK